MQAILALETSTDACSVALEYQGRVSHRHQVEARAHNRLLLPMVQELLAEAGLRPADLDALAFGRGPGSFTGLRLAAAVTQGLAWAADLPVLGLSSLEVTAATALHGNPQAAGIITLLDARMGECYWNAYAVRGGELEVLGEDAVAPPEEVPERWLQRCQPAGRWLWLGSELLSPASRSWPGGLEIEPLPPVWPEARVLLRLAAPRLRAGQGLPAAAAVPAYLRDASRWRRLDVSSGSSAAS